MNQLSIKRFKSLENSITALRILNESETLRDEIKFRNRVRIRDYSDEICEQLCEECKRLKKPVCKG